jgi:hypothetical protein
MEQAKVGRPKVTLKEQEMEKESMTSKATTGTFICVNTVNVKGYRLNLANVFSYAPKDEYTIHVSQGDGNNTQLTFPSSEEMRKALTFLDEKCLA